MWNFLRKSPRPRPHAPIVQSTLTCATSASGQGAGSLYTQPRCMSKIQQKAPLTSSPHLQAPIKFLPRFKPSKSESALSKGIKATPLRLYQVMSTAVNSFETMLCSSMLAHMQTPERSSAVLPHSLPSQSSRLSFTFCGTLTLGAFLANPLRRRCYKLFILQHNTVPSTEIHEEEIPNTIVLIQATKVALSIYEYLLKPSHSM